MDELRRDPLTWSVPVGRFSGIRVRIHIFFLIFLAFQLALGYRDGGVIGLQYTASWGAILFVSVLLHEFGHCFAARWVGGDAEEILIWPLGGLAFVSAPNTPRDQFITTVAGPLVNLAICLVSAAVILGHGASPQLNPLSNAPLAVIPLVAGDGSIPVVPMWLVGLGMVFGVNWIMFLFNFFMPAFPLDGGRMLRCALWPRLGFARATTITVLVAKIAAVVLGIVGVLQVPPSVLLVAIAIFVYISSESERRMLEAGMLFDDSVFGYDFSQGYTSLAKSGPRQKARRPNFIERWWRRRQQAKRQRELAEQQEQERQVDQILAKLHREGMASLTDQERRLLTRASQKYRSRNRSDR
jgi:Zn-dependent protease